MTNRRRVTVSEMGLRIMLVTGAVVVMGLRGLQLLLLPFQTLHSLIHALPLSLHGTLHTLCSSTCSSGSSSVSITGQYCGDFMVQRLQLTQL